MWNFRDDNKNEKLDNPVITPTTKGEVDELISYDEILRRRVVTKEELDLYMKKQWNYIYLV